MDSVHTLAEHTFRLDSLCRLCGERVTRVSVVRDQKYTIYGCVDFANEILRYHNVDIVNDQRSRHPQKVCSKCQKRLFNFRTSVKSPSQSKVCVNALWQTDASSTIWVDFDSTLSISECASCTHYEKQKKGGRPKKAQKRLSNSKRSSSSQDSSILSTPWCSTPNKIPRPSDPTTAECLITNQISPVTPQCDRSEMEQTPLTEQISPGTPQCDRSEMEQTPLTEQISPGTPQCDRSQIEQTPLTEQISPGTPQYDRSEIEQTPLTEQTPSVDSGTPIAREVQDKATLTSPSLLKDLLLQYFGTRSPTLTQEGATSTQEKEAKEHGTSPFTRPQAMGLKVRPVHEICSPNLTQDEEKYATHLYKMKLSQSNDGTVKYATGGQSLRSVNIPQPRKPTTSATDRTVSARVNLIHRIRILVSGDSEQDAVDQQTAEIKKQVRISDLKTKSKLMTSVGCAPVRLTPIQCQALKVKLGLSMGKHKHLRKVLRSSGVCLPTEKQEKRELNAALSGEISVKATKVFVSDENDKEKTKEVQMPVGYVDDIPKFIRQLLNKKTATKQLTWHSGKIPKDEVWIKLGADHGGGSFKVMVQTLNVQNPNSKHNTSIIILAHCKDSPDNMRRILQPCHEQLKSLQGMRWRGKTVRVFVFGDYDFLLKAYGLSGAQGVHPCLYCTASKVQLQMPPAFNEGNLVERTLKTIKADHKRFRRAKRKIAKHHNNVVRKQLLSVDTDHIAPPYLHILLGVTKKHHLLLEKECNSLDRLIGEELAKHNENCDTCTSSFSAYMDGWKKIEAMEADKLHLETHIFWDEPDNDTPLATFQERQKEMQDQINDAYDAIEKEKKELDLPLLSGPVTSSLDIVLKKHKIYMQAYHGRSFVGNHCNKYFKADTINNICDSVTKNTEMFVGTDRARISAKAQDICNKFKTINTLYSEVHTHISHSRPMTEDDIEESKNAISRYMSTFRHMFPHVRVIPKQHLLEYHCIPFVRRWGFGLGAHGEQGGEETHATINVLKRRVWGLKTQEDQIRVILREHMFITSPTLAPCLEKRKQ